VEVDVFTAVNMKFTALWDVNFCPEDGRSRFLRNVNTYLQDYKYQMSRVNAVLTCNFCSSIRVTNVVAQ
jgi:hypothetical protein